MFSSFTDFAGEWVGESIKILRFDVGIKFDMRISTCVGPILRTPCAQKLTRLFVDSLSTTNRKSFIGPDQLAPVVRMYSIMSRSHIKFVVLTMHSKPPNQCRNDLSTDQSLNSMHFEIGLEPSSGVRPQRLDRIDGLWRLMAFGLAVSLLGNLLTRRDLSWPSALSSAVPGAMSDRQFPVRRQNRPGHHAGYPENQRLG